LYKNILSFYLHQWVRTGTGNNYCQYDAAETIWGNSIYRGQQKVNLPQAALTAGAPLFTRIPAVEA